MMTGSEYLVWLLSPKRRSCAGSELANRLLTLFSHYNQWPTGSTILHSCQFHDKTAHPIVAREDFNWRLESEYGSSEAIHLIQICCLGYNPSILWCWDLSSATELILRYKSCPRHKGISSDRNNTSSQKISECSAESVCRTIEQTRLPRRLTAPLVTPFVSALG